jgi:hypothetical protein
MITIIAIVAVALCVVVISSRRWGFRKVMKVAAMVFLAAPGAWCAAIILSSVLQGVKGPGVTTWIVVALLVGLAAWLIAKKIGWEALWQTLLGGALGLAMFGTLLVVVVFVYIAVFARAPGGH